MLLDRADGAQAIGHFRSDLNLADFGQDILYALTNDRMIVCKNGTMNGLRDGDVLSPNPRWSL